MPEARRIAEGYGVRQIEVEVLANSEFFHQKMHSFIDLKPLSAYQYGRSAFPAMKFAPENEPGPASSNLERTAGSGISGAVAERDFAARPMRSESGRGGRVQG